MNVPLLDLDLPKYPQLDKINVSQDDVEDSNVSPKLISEAKNELAHPLSILKSCPLNISKPLLDIFMKLCTNIKQDQTICICSNQGPLLYLVLQNHAPLKSLNMEKKSL